MTISTADCLVISPYEIFDRLIGWIIGAANKNIDQMRNEIASARAIVDRIESALAASKPLDERGKEKLHISFEKLSEARERLAQADDDINLLASPYPAR